MRTTGRSAAASIAALLTVLSFAPAGARPARLQKQSFTVIAVVDSGINPYHLDFRRPDLTAHPATYVTGYPNSTRALDLHLGARDLASARQADAEEWARLAEGELRWIPGTNIIGIVGIQNIGESAGFDEFGHGTGVASVAAGMRHGPGREDILLVSVEGTDRGLAWAAEQPWIDIITNSWSVLTPVLDETAEASHRAVESGKIVCFASGNLHAPLIFLEGQGPSWHVNVGAASSKSRTERWYTGYPNDVLGLSGFDAASNTSIDGTREFGGTSAAAPWVCSHIAQTLATARRNLGDTREGPHGGGLAAGRKGRGYLDDGVLDRLELEDAVQSTAVPASSEPDPDDPNTVPALPVAPYLRGGYGIVDGDTIRDGLKVIFGKMPRPEREMEDAWIAATDALRDRIWGDPP
jgi:hypothetical protein